MLMRLVCGNAHRQFRRIVGSSHYPKVAKISEQSEFFAFGRIIWMSRPFILGSFILGALLIQGIVLYFLGQPVICTCGYIKPWEGDVSSSGNSQHVADWYTPSHIIHGFILYFILWILFPRMSFMQRLLIAVGVEAAWEMYENTPWLIEQYRQQALAAGYVGDSILNSLSDTAAMISGFFFASVMPAWLTVLSILGLEAVVGYSIRDNLTLNILNFLHQFKFISDWQSRL